MKIKVRQEPIHGKVKETLVKAIGFKQQFGNFIDPALILELVSENQNDYYKHHQKLLATVTLVRSDNTDSSVLIVPPKISMNDEEDDDPSSSLHLNLRGTCIKAGVRLQDPEDNTWKTFFIFDDLSIRTQDTYKLHCSLSDMSNPFTGVLCDVMTRDIKVTSSRNYSGNIAMTNLTKAFVSQGGLNVGRRRKSQAFV